jgi:hypothetical protein
MNKLDVSSPILTLSPAPNFAPEPGRRLIVLFPASEFDDLKLSRRIWEIARSLQLNVLLLSLCNDFEEESQLRRKLVTMASIIKDPNVSTDIMIEHGNDWVGQVRNIWRAGDMVACFAGQKMGLMRKPLDQVLRSNFETPIYILADYQPAMNPNSTFISKASSWLGSLAIIGGFLLAEVKIVQLPHDWAHTALLYVGIFVEIAAIFLWNSLFT